MPEEIFIISMVAIIFGTSLVGFVLWNIFSLIKTKMNGGKSSSADLNPQFFKALGEFKKTTERRIANLEAIVSELEEEKIRIPESGTSTGDIEIEDEDVRTETKQKDNNNLRNMLGE